MGGLWNGCFQSLSRVWLFATAWTVAHLAPLSKSPPCLNFPGKNYWNGLPFPFPRDLPNSGIEPTSLALADGFFTTEPSGKPWWMKEGSCWLLWDCKILFDSWVVGIEQSPGYSDGKESACNSWDPGFDPWVGKIPWRREWLPTQVIMA